MVQHLANHVDCIYAQVEKRFVKDDGFDLFVGLELRDTQRMNMVVEITDNLLTSAMTLSAISLTLPGSLNRALGSEEVYPRDVWLWLSGTSQGPPWRSTGSVIKEVIM